MENENIRKQGNGEIIASYIAVYGMNAFAFTWIFFSNLGLMYIASLIVSSVILYFLTKDAFADYQKNYIKINKHILLAEINKEKVKYSRVAAIMMRMFIMVFAIAFSTNIACIMFNCPDYLNMTIVPISAAIVGFMIAQRVIPAGYYPHNYPKRDSSLFKEHFSDKITSDISCGITPPGHLWDNKH